MLQSEQKHTPSTLLAALSLQVQSTQEAKDSAIALLTRREFRGRPLRGHAGGVLSVAFSADGTRILSGGWDNTLRLWDAKLLKSSDGLRSILCQTSHRNLTKAEWKQYVPEGEDYRAVCRDLPVDE